MYKAYIAEQEGEDESDERDEGHVKGAKQDEGERIQLSDDKVVPSNKPDDGDQA